MKRTTPIPVRRGGVAAVVGAVVAALPLAAVPAGAEVSGGESIEVFTGSNLVSLTSYPANADVKVEVLRQGFVIGSAVKTTDATGLIEMNHVGGTDCFDPPSSPDIMPGDTLRTTVVGTDNVDTSVVRGVFVESFDINPNSITVAGHVTLQGAAAVVPGTDVLELRINKASDNIWEFNDRPGRTDRRVDIGANVNRQTGQWSITLQTSQDDIDDLQAKGFEHFLEWSAGAAAGEAEEAFPSELTVWDLPEGEALDCPPLQDGPTAPQLVDPVMDSGTAGDHVTNQSANLTFGGLAGSDLDGLTAEPGAGAQVRLLFGNGNRAAAPTVADADGVYVFAGIDLEPRRRPYELMVRAKDPGEAPSFTSAVRLVRIDTRSPAVRVRSFRPNPLNLKGRERLHVVYRIRERSVLDARVQRRTSRRWRTVQTFRDRTRRGRAEYNWNGRNEIRRNVRPGRYRMVLTAIDRAGNRTVQRNRLRVVRADRSTRPRIRRASSGARGGRNTAIATWRRPADNGGARITGYQVKALRIRRNGTVADRTVSEMLRPRERSQQMRLRRGRYRFRVRAFNAAGRSPWSARSNEVRSR